MAGVAPDRVTMSVISACAVAGSLDIGRWVHAYIQRQMIDIDLELGTALINMFAKCGYIDKAKEIFEKMYVKDTKPWNSLILGLPIHGLSDKVIKWFYFVHL